MYEPTSTILLISISPPLVNYFLSYIFFLEMDNFTDNLFNELPFYNSSNSQIIQLFQSDKDEFFTKLANNKFSKNMLKHVNGFSKTTTLVVIIKIIVSKIY